MRKPGYGGTPMTHYGITQWVDFARGVAGSEEGAAMREHLSSGCEECRQLAAFCEMLSQVCRGMAAHETPDSVTRCAQAICPPRQRQSLGQAMRLPVELIFDSFLVPSPAGLRSSWQVGWQALYRAGDCSLDVRIEPDLRSSRAALIGQVSNHAAPEVQMGNIPVYLKVGKQVVAETRSNRFGEFQIEYEQQRRLQLCVYLEGGAKCIVAPLRRIAADKAGGEWNASPERDSKGAEKDS